MHTVIRPRSFSICQCLVPCRAIRRGSRTDADLPVLREPHGAAAENFRTLRTSLSLLAPPMERRISLFTSAVPGEGKSFCAANYAIALAQQGCAPS